ncbi:DUF5916 domain-containing protein [Thalassotalea fusca]
MMKALTVLIFGTSVFAILAPLASANVPTEFINKQFLVANLNDVAKPLAIDGNLNEEIWQHASVVEDFHQVKPSEYQQPTQATKVMMFYGEDSLYIGAQLYDEPKQILATQFIQGRNLNSDDQFHITIDAFDNQRTGTFFQINPNGVRREALIENDAFHADWQTLWEGDAQINEHGWSLEMRIPYQSLSFDPSSESWGINFGRVIRRHREIIAWSSRGANSWEMAPSASGKINSPKVENSGNGLEVKASLIAKSHVDHEGDNTTMALEPSLDIFYKPSPELTLAATVNTDFSATDVDDRVINLSRFSVFLPEKRSFFLQDIDIFEFGGLTGNGRPFFSRKIGLDSSGKPLGIDAGVKLTGRINGINYGFLDVLQDSGVDGQQENVFVGRVTTDIFDESTVGVITTQGNPNSMSSSSLWGADFNFRDSDAINGNVVQGNLWFQKSFTSDAGDDQEAYGITMAYPNESLYARLRHNVIGNDFSPALGFVNRAGIKESDLSYGHIVRFQDGLIRRWTPWIDANYVTDLSGRMLNKEARFYPATVLLNNNYFFAVRLVESTQVLDDSFNIFDDIEVQPGRYDETRYGVRIITPSHDPLSLDINYEQGDFLSGNSKVLQLKLNWRPSPRWLLSAEYQRTIASLAEGEFTARLYRLNSELAITSDWSWLTTAQFENGSKRLGINSRLRYQPSAAQSFNLVVEHNMVDTEKGFQSLETHYVTKLDYSYRF